MISLFCSDFDNTLARRSKISSANLDAIKSLNNNGVEFALVTGRPLANARRLLSNHGIVANIVAANGSVIGLMDGNIKAYPFEPPALLKLLNICNERKYFFICYGVDFCLLPSWLPFFNNGPISKIIEKTSSMKTSKISPKNYKALSDSQEIVKVSIYPLFHSAEKLWDELSADKRLYITTASMKKLEISSAGVSKWNGIIKLADMLGKPIDEVASIGDFLNDISMLEPAKYSFAMGNAPDQVKKVAKEIVADIKNDGFAEAVRRVLEINKEK